MRLGKNFPGNGALPSRTHKPRLFGDSLPDVTLPPAIPPDFVARPLWDISIQIGYATALLNLLAKSEAAAKPAPSSNARKSSVHRTDPEKIALGNLLREIAEISTRNKLLNRSDFANLLKKRSKYKHLSLRTLRRYVTYAIAWETNLLQQTPPDLWLELFGIDPPSEMTKRALFEKSLEFLR